MRARRILAYLLTLPLIGPCVSPGRAQESTQHRSDSEAPVVAEISRMHADWNAARNAGDFERMMVLVADDVIFMLEGAPAVVGKPALMKVRWWFEQNDVDEAVTEEEVVVEGGLAFLRGTGTGQATPRGGGEPSPIRSKYIWILKRQFDGSWKLWRVISNSDTPPSCP